LRSPQIDKKSREQFEIRTDAQDALAVIVLFYEKVGPEGACGAVCTSSRRPGSPHACSSHARR
jgi:hypothetical protein